ncbi:LysR family transcriptional regulator [Altererythrobacter indicus]|uniref:LysR family transcriptional regulator n=1 Tax=Altericroceibacterium indicum TaxID=374177 RepID=A0A845A2Q4_9SPHN|nr:LysR family transcriptional regulator [Altericroceibacterium indicum]MXP24450.1 LysR family transcriptional regulator [Altericroceibacterium indicum]
MSRSPSMASLRLFVQVAHNLSFSKTARLAHVSQPALSRTIRLLEEQLDVRLFDRNSRNVVLTPAGETLLPIVERLIADFDHAFVSLEQTFAGERGRVVVGALPSIAATVLPERILEFREAHPYTEIIVHDHLDGSLYQQLHDRQIDIAITTEPTSDAFEFLPMIRDEYVMVCQRGTEFDQQGEIDWSVFTKSPFLAMTPRSSVRAATDQAFASARMSVKPLYECTQLATMGGLLAAGLGITALPASTLAMLGRDNLVSHRLSSPVVTRQIGVAYLASRTMPPVAQAFVKHFLSKPSMMEEISRYQGKTKAINRQS